MRVTATVNGVAHQADDVWPGESLLFVLRERMGLPGSKNACEQGECGSCTVYLDGIPVCACLVAAGQAEGREIVTVEGLATSATELSPLQEAFRDNHGLQCGFCTPGMLTTLTEFLRDNPDPTEAEVRVAISGNLCRCTGYQNIVAAALDAAKRLRSGKGSSS